VLQRWNRFARALTPAHCESLLTRAAEQGLGSGSVVQHSGGAATDGWSLENRGYVTELDTDGNGFFAGPLAGPPWLPAQQQFGW
jgi:hypothetical protein